MILAKVRFGQSRSLWNRNPPTQHIGGCEQLGERARPRLGNIARITSRLSDRFLVQLTVDQERAARLHSILSILVVSGR
jgi:hypothetical protein